MEENKYRILCSDNTVIIASETNRGMEYKDWLNKYKPITNPHCHAPFDGLMFETFEKELDHVHRVRENNKQSVWTLIDADGRTMIIPGYRHINRLGYFITEVTWNDDAISVTVD